MEAVAIQEALIRERAVYMPEGTLDMACPQLPLMNMRLLLQLVDLAPLSMAVTARWPEV